jgi:hypothetical protein
MILSEVIMDVEVVAMDPCRGPGTPGPATHREAGSWWFWCWKIEENGCFEWDMMVNDDDILGISWGFFVSILAIIKGKSMEILVRTQ